MKRKKVTHGDEFYRLKGESMKNPGIDSAFDYAQPDILRRRLINPVIRFTEFNEDCLKPYPMTPFSFSNKILILTFGSPSPSVSMGR